MISIYDLKQDIIEVRGQLDDGNLEAAKDVFRKLEDDINEVMGVFDRLLSDVKR
ncbi:hypothetical protein ACTFJW_11310 [Clostridium cagae]|uniref:hypothetical protein n=1 Tax=Clostridium cagae TaxID=2080751 RepID=UPI003F775090